MNTIPTYKAAPEAEIVRGAAVYGETLRLIHERLHPRVYVEIGIRHGFSLGLAQCDTIVGIDPQPELRVELSKRAHIAEMTSDAFFASDDCAAILGQPIDFAFIDGMHLFEFALRDFINVERRASRSGIVAFDDVFPNHPIQARRQRESGVWTGDVWKMLACLRKYRQDLRLLTIDTTPTGMLLASNLDPENDVLRRNYDAIVAEYARDLDVPSRILARDGAMSPSDPGLRDFLDNRA
jgi:Methyltransferase domain